MNRTLIALAASFACALPIVAWEISYAQVGLGGGTAGPGSVGPSGGDTGGGSGGEADELAIELNDADPAVRLFAVQRLAVSKDDKAVQYLIDACADVDTRVRLKAIDSLGAMRANSATPSLVQILYLRQSEPWLKQRVLVALGKIGDNRAGQPITDLINRDKSPRTVGTALFALGEIGDPSTIPALERVAESSEDPTVKRLATDAIAKINRSQINPEIEIQALRPDPNEVQRPASASAGSPLAY